MKLLVINQFGVSRAIYNYIETFPSKNDINSMAKAGYKFRIDGKPVTKKKIEELRQQEHENNKTEES